MDFNNHSTVWTIWLRQQMMNIEPPLITKFVASINMFLLQMSLYSYVQWKDNTVNKLLDIFLRLTKNCFEHKMSYFGHILY